VDIGADGAAVTQVWRGGVYQKSSAPIVRIRVFSGGGGGIYAPNSVIVITDKPQGKLPLDLDAIESGLIAAAAQVAA
jgi:hypothetical protein